MKLRKGLIQILTFVAILVAGLSVATISNATLYTNGRLLKATNPTYRPVYVENNWVDAFAYNLGIVSGTTSIEGTHDQDMWKIYEYNKVSSGSAATIKNYNNAIYCIKMGQGFGSINGSTMKEKTYNAYADMKNPVTSDVSMINYYRNNIMASDTEYTPEQKYNALIWVLDHCYVPAPSSEAGQNTETAQRAAEYRAKLLTNAGIANSKINDDMIDIVQQVAIWYFTNNDRYKGGYTDANGNHLGISSVLVTVKNGATSNIDDYFHNNNLNSDIDKLFDYFVKGGLTNINTAPSTTATAPVEFVNTTAQAEIVGDYYIAGPYKINQISTGAEYNLEASVKEGTNTISYTLLDSNKQPVENNNIKLIVGNDFYIKIPKTVDLENVEFNATWSIYQNTITYLTIQGSETSEQPLAEVIPEIKSDKITATVQFTPANFDLALRKYISKVETAGVTTTYENNGERKSNVDTTPLTATGSTATTANYKHRKDPVVVETGSLVTYKLNIYNEGNVAGRATKVVDQLPAGMKFLNVVSGNFESDGTYTETTNKLTLVRTAGDTTDLAAFENGQLASETIEILCEVTATPDENDDKVYTNIAWIADYASNEGTFTDRDSDGNSPVMPTSLVTTNDGYINEAKNSGKQLDNKNAYFEGQQDDDDFEKVKIKAINGSYNIILVKEDRNGEQLDSTATFEVNGTTVTVTGRLTIVSDRKINADNVSQIDTYTIKELVPPDEYCKFDGTIKVEVYKELKDGKYVVKEIKYYVDNVEVTTNRDDLNVYLNTNGNIYVEVKDYQFDLALRKFITAVNDTELKDVNGKYTREPNIDTSKLNTLGEDGTLITTAEYKHEKQPVNIAVGDTVIYTIRVYNEGDVDGYASEITDHLPAQLEFINDDFNAGYQWELDSNDKTKRTVKTKILARTDIDPEENLIKAFNGRELDYKEVKIKCRVKSTERIDKYITNIADITACTDYKGETVQDRDSQVNNVVLPNDSNLPDYKGNNSNKSILSDKDYYYKGQQDDDDFEKLVLQEFDLALRKFITKINDDAITSRIPVVDASKLKSGESTTATYTHPKNPLEVETTDIVEYTIRVYNEGDIAGYANVVKDDIPQGLLFLPEDETNKEYRWIMVDENGVETDDVSKATHITTDYLSREQELVTARDNLLKAFDTTKDTPDYKDVKVAFKVIAPNTYEGIITNKAQISDDKDENGKDVEDRDSHPDVWIEGEDDQDVEHIKLLYFDLALRKFITGVNDKEITDRIPVFKITEDGKYVYEHTKEPVEVENKNVVTYTLRIFNEGTKAGYANLVRDDIPEGLVFLPENETNKEYRWVMVDEDGVETNEVSKAVSIVTDYLSIEQGKATGRDNLLRSFDRTTMESPDYRDIKVAFKVTEPNTSDRIIINHAQISDDKDEEGKDVTDIDSHPDKWIEGEDDQDIEKIKVKYFDLALRKWVTEAIIIENGKETVVQTGHKAEDDPEEVVKVDLKEKNYKNVVVKFRYSIRVKNEGQIAGYCTEISDYIPEGLKFVPEDNPQWKEVNGKITTDILKDTLLQPGESAETEVLLTWINGKDNFGLKVNTAEISEDKNDSDTPDIDSVPNNKKPGEDDIDDAPVILTVKTGVENVMPVAGTIAISLVIISAGAILIKKYVL